MRVLLDECIPPSAGDVFREHGQEVDHITSLGHEGVANGEVYAIARAGYDILVTSDRHFRRPTPFPATEALGIVYLVPVAERFSVEKG